MPMRVLTTDDEADWLATLERCRPHDVYALPQYHRLAEGQGEGRAHLFVHEEGGHVIALPLLLRPLDSFAGTDSSALGWCDATSVYGYAGPLSSHGTMPEPMMRGFRRGLESYLREREVVSVFSRLHPLLPHEEVLAGLGECRFLQETVSLDLRLPPAVQRAAYRQNHLDGIRKLTRQGVTAARDEGMDRLGDFIDIYYETMHRCGAREYYFFPRDYFTEYVRLLRPHVHLFLCHREGRPICGGLVTTCHGIAQYHLGGARNEYLKLAPMKLLVDTMRAWCHEQGLEVLHLGGGVSSRPDDPLLHFKKGFSDRRHRFSVWRWVVRPDAYEQLCRATGTWDDEQGRAAVPGDYFPAYRAPSAAYRKGVDEAHLPVPSPPRG